MFVLLLGPGFLPGRDHYRYLQCRYWSRYLGGGHTIEIFDLNGKLVQRENTEFEAGRIDHGLNVRDLPAGIYAVSCRVGYEHFTARFVKQ